jgi:transposase InsO family protein
MDTLSLKPPAGFSFQGGNLADHWKLFKQQFQLFICAAGKEQESDKQKTSLLLCCLGEEGLQVYNTFVFVEGEQWHLETVLEKFDGYFTPQKNVTLERHRFFTRHQQEGEPFAQYMTALRNKAATCDFGDLKDSLIKDQIVTGIKNSRLREQLLREHELTLDRCTAICLAAENSHAHVQELMKHANVDAIGASSTVPSRPVPAENRQRWKPAGKRAPTPSPSSFSGPRSARNPGVCSRCGHAPHGTKSCPAQGAVCRKCGKRNHYAKMCRSAAHIATQESDIQQEIIASQTTDYFVGAIVNHRVGPWTAVVKVDTVPIQFKLDTGADCTSVSQDVAKQLGVTLRSSPRKLFGPGGKELPVNGCFTAQLQYKGKTMQTEIFVVRDLSVPLLGRPELSHLELLARVDRVAATPGDLPLQASAEFAPLFKGLGRMNDPYAIKLNPDVRPFALTVPRAVPVPLQSKVKAKLDDMLQQGVISPVSVPTEWCAAMVVVPKRSGEVRICVDLTGLNKAVQREVYPLPQTDHLLCQLAGAKVFSKLDANSGFWQIPLAEESKLLTTFVTPFGRFCFNVLPFGITSAPEHFQRRVSAILSGLEGVVCMMDDILIHGCSQAEHDARLHAVLSRLKSAGLTLNKEKCTWAQTKVTFLGHVVSAEGIAADPEKTAALLHIPEPKNVSEVRSFLGIVNQFGKFSPHLAELSQPLRELLRRDISWLWTTVHVKAFKQLKHEICSARTLALYDCGRPTTVSADASSFGLGAVLLQEQEDGTVRPVAFSSRSLTDTERRYAQIEKEALAITWACEKFSHLITGLTVNIETDHKPLVPLLSQKCISELSPRIQRFRMRLMRYSYTICYKPGTQMYVADCLSRMPQAGTGDNDLQEEAEVLAAVVIESLPVSMQRLGELRQLQSQDPITRQVMQYCETGWPLRLPANSTVHAYWHGRDQLAVCDNLLLYGSRLVIPADARQDILDKLHAGHLGITKTRELARQSVWWPGLSSQIADAVHRCPQCRIHQPRQKEPLLTTKFPDYPWQHVATDIFELQQRPFLLVVDFYSRFVELAALRTMSSDEVITHLKSIFARHGIPELVTSDNGPQYASATFKAFAQAYGFTHATSSPRFPQSNGEAERAVRTMKSLLSKSSDPYLALLQYRAAPLQNGYSPAQLLFGRHLRTQVPTLPSNLSPTGVDAEKLKQKEAEYRENQEAYFNKRHRTVGRTQLHAGQEVYLPDLHRTGHVSRVLPAPRSVAVATQQGEVRRNTAHVVPLEPESQEVQISAPRDNTITLRSGKTVFKF